MEIIANALQTVQANQSVYFTDTIVGGNNSISHRSNSGIVSLLGNTNQWRARFKITFGANIAVPTGETVGPISLAIAIDGEAVPSTTMTVTPAAVETFFNVFSAIFVDVPRSIMSSISVRNISTIPVEVENANLIIERVA